MSNKDFDFSGFGGGGWSGLDAFMGSEPFADAKNKVAAERRRIASLDDLAGFSRIANTDTLIHKSDRDLWALKKDDKGNHFVERLFDDKGDPLKG